MNISHIHLYSCSIITKHDLENLTKNLSIFPNVKIEIRDPFLVYFSKNSDCNLNSIEKTRFPLNQAFFQDINKDDFSFVKSSIPNNITHSYEGFSLQRILSNCIIQKELGMDHVHVIFLDELVCTYDEKDNRQHARTVICGTPSIISVTGIIEGPAKPREYYLKKMMKNLLGLNELDLKEEFSERYIDYDDPRLLLVASGIAMQAIFFFLTKGDPFCEDKRCRLFNSHWQYELIKTQVNNPNLCKDHYEILQKNLF